MTETTKTVFEKYEIRKTKTQKTAFIEYVQSVANENGYTCTIEKGAFGVRNIVIGSPEKAKVLYTAHYDTPSVMPFPNFITPKHFILYLLYQIVVSLLFMIVPCGTVTFLASKLLHTTSSLSLLLVFEASLLCVILLMICGPANRHTANDNTSGVTLLLDLMVEMPTVLRENAAFVFFDLEEAGLLGSSAFAKKHAGAHRKPLINFDCVSDGEHILFAVKKEARAYMTKLKESFTEDEYCTTEFQDKGVFYPSDQANFKQGIAVASLKRFKKTNILYADRIHTRRDTIYREENIRFLVQKTIHFTKKMNDI